MALYCVRFQFGINVNATSSEEAIARVSKMIQGAPEIAIRGAELATMYRKKGLLRTSFFG
jgi:hypothetical protein